jgi:hypothetical protein
MERNQYIYRYLCQKKIGGVETGILRALYSASIIRRNWEKTIDFEEISIFCIDCVCYK